MKRQKKLLILLAVLVTLSAATLAAGKIPDSKASGEEETAQVVFSLDPETVTALEWEYSEELAFDRTENGWTYRDNSAFPVEQTYLQTILDTLSEVTSYKTIENVENWDTYGLEIPVCTISLTAGETYTLAIGSETSLGGQRYFSCGDGKAYLVEESVISPFQYGLYDLMEQQTMPEVEDLTAMRVAMPGGGYTVSREENNGRTYSDEYVWFWENQALDTQLTQNLVGTITGLNLSNCVNYDADATDLSTYGLDQPEASVTVFDGGKAAYTLDIGGTGDGVCYVRLADSNMVFQLDDELSQTICYTTAADLLPDEVLLMDWDTVDTVTVVLEDAEATFTRGQTTDEDGNAVSVWKRDGEETELAETLTMLTDMASNGYATGLTPDQEPRVRFQITRQRQLVELAFYPYTSTACMVTVNGEATVTVSRQSVTELIQALEKQM